MFQTNESNTERLMRISAGAVLIALFFLNPEADLRWLTLVGIVPLATGVIGWCPIYRLLGRSTCAINGKTE